MTHHPAPDLWPGMDASTATERAWLEVWRILDPEQWTPWADVVEHLSYSHPEVKKATANKIIYAAKRNRLIQKRGGYSHKNKTDTRMIRRHPATQETTAP